MRQCALTQGSASFQYVFVLSAASLLRRLPLFWRLQIAGWGIFSLVGLAVRAIVYRSAVSAALMTVYTDSVGFLFSTLLRFAYLRLQLNSGLTLRSGSWAVLLSAAAALVHASTMQFFFEWTGRVPPGWTIVEKWLQPFIFRALLYLSWSFMYLWLKAEFASRNERQRAMEAAAVAQRAELEVLRSQINPHFLFNALNGIETAIETQPESAQAMVRELSDYLRYSLQLRHVQTVSLSEELKAMQSYLNIECARFGARIEVCMQASQSAREMQVPVFLLQPLVENAVKHGLSTSPRPLRIALHAEVSADNTLEIRVRNTGRIDRRAPDEKRSTGVGLENLRRRLALHYKNGACFELQEKEGGVEALLRLKGATC